MTMGRNRALGKKAPGVQVRAKNSDVATCQDASLLLGYRENRGMLSTRDSKKGLRRVLIRRESLERVPAARLRLCLRRAVSWMGVA